jgi:hypothetical protein
MTTTALLSSRSVHEAKSSRRYSQSFTIAREVGQGRVRQNHNYAAVWRGMRRLLLYLEGTGIAGKGLLGKRA